MMCEADGNFALQTCLWEAHFLSFALLYVINRAYLLKEPSRYKVEALGAAFTVPFLKVPSTSSNWFPSGLSIPYKIALFHFWQKNYTADPLCEQQW